MNPCLETVAPAQLLSWDSEFFGHRIARVRGDTMTWATAEALEQWSIGEQIEVLYFLARADCSSSIQTAQEHGFYLTDIRLTLTTLGGGSTGVNFAHESPDILIRPAQTSDVPGLETIARRSHRDTRFFSDSRFPRSKAEELYATWIRLECEGKADQVLVAGSVEGAPLGYVSCHYDPESSSGQIGLFATHESIRGRGVGKRLVGAAFEWFSKKGAQEISVVTQGRNIAAQRLYQGCGFRTAEVQLWLHKWIPAA